MQNKNQLLLSPDISPDGVITGGGAPTPPEQPVIETPIEKEEDKEKGEEQYEVKELEESTVTIDDFEKLENLDIVPPKKEEKEKEKEEEEGVVEKSKPVARDYSDIEEIDRDLFKNMSNAAFAKLKPVYLEHKKLQDEKTKLETDLVEARKAGLPPNYFEHPDGYVFDTDYRTTQETLNYASGIAAHWKQQLENIERGEDWRELSVDASGKLTLSEPKAGDPTGRVTVLTYYQNALNHENNFRAKLDTIREGFKTKHTAVTSEIKQIEDGWFPSFKDEKAEISIVAKDLLKKLPSAIQNSPLATAFARSITTILQQKKLIETLEETVKKAPKVATSTSKGKAGPTASSMGAAPKPSKESNVTFEDFEKIMGE